MIVLVASPSQHGWATTSSATAYTIVCAVVRCGACSVEIQAERMAVWVEHHAYAFLRLEICQLGAGLDRMRDRLVEVVDLEIEMHLHLLLAVFCRPDGALVLVLQVEAQV